MEDKRYKHLDYLHRRTDAYAEAKYRIITHWLPARDNLRVLNAGCGSGEMNVLLSRNRTWSVDAIDTDAEAVKMSRDMASNLGAANVRILRRSIEDLQARETYDVAVCNDVLEHIKDDLAAMQKLSELLKDGGVLLVSVPAMPPLFGHHDEMLGHYRRYGRKELVGKLSVGFEVEQCRYFGFSFIPIALWYSRIRRADYPIGRIRENSFAQKVVKTILGIEEVLGVPLGTTLLAKAIRKKWTQ